jgi:hypothetical protein
LFTFDMRRSVQRFVFFPARSAAMAMAADMSRASRGLDDGGKFGRRMNEIRRSLRDATADPANF